jgi:adenosylmethionine-8-amino-7-oxononanoate aminotransferase
MVQRFWGHPHVGDIRCEGLICAIELVEDFATRRSFSPAQRVGHRVCEAARKHGLLTRNIGDVLVLMPPYCATDAQLTAATDALWRALNEVLCPS